MFIAIAFKAALVALAAHAAAILLIRRSAAERHVMWVAAIAVLLALPWMERTAPAVVLLDAPAAAPVVSRDVAVSAEATSPVDWVSRLWLGGVCVVLAWQAVGLALLRFRRRQRFDSPMLEGLCADLSISRRVRLYTSAQAHMPMTWGVARPSIVLPESAANWSGERLRIVLLHELAHVARYDFLTQLAATMACALYWYNPLVWLSAAAMRREREKACDDVVLRQGASGCDYAEHLLALASSGMTPAGAVPMAQRSHLESRIRAALNPGLVRHAPSRSLRFGAATIALVMLSGIVVVKTTAQGRGQVEAVVMDISNAVVPGVEVRAIAENGSRQDIAQTSPEGKVTFTGLPDGNYTLEVRAPGFAMLRKAITLKNSETAAYALRLAMGKISETVSVVGKGQPREQFAPTPRSSAAPQRIRVGGSVQAAKLVRQPKPEYPLHLQQQGIEGTVLLEGVISMEGTLLSLRSLNSLVHPEMVKAAMDAVSQWRYRPTLLNGKPVEIVTTININYKLEP